MYKKDSKDFKGYPNGEFRFGIGEDLIMIDDNITMNDW